jgi:hypothetical protein
MEIFHVKTNLIKTFNLKKNYFLKFFENTFLIKFNCPSLESLNNIFFLTNLTKRYQHEINEFAAETDLLQKIYFNHFKIAIVNR